jgi:hypothetical protein
MCSAAVAQNRGGGVAGGMPGGSQHGGPPAGGRPPIGMPGRVQQPVFGAPLANPFLYPTFAQRLAATVSGHWNGTPVYWGSPGTFSGFGRFGGFGGSRGGGAFAGQGVYGVPFPVYSGDSYGPSYYAPPYYGPPSAPPQPSNVTVVFPPLPVAPPPVITIAENQPDIRMAQSQSVSPPQDTLVRMPPQDPVVLDEYPAVVAVSNGGIYSVTNYWKKGDVFHFITTQGNHMQVPSMMVERLFPRQKNGRSVDPAGPPSRR